MDFLPPLRVPQAKGRPLLLYNALRLTDPFSLFFLCRYDVYRGGGGGGGGSTLVGGGGGDGLPTSSRRNGFGSTYRNSRQGSRSRQRQQKASDIISGGGVGGGYGASFGAGAGAGGNTVVSSGYGASAGGSSFLPAPSRQEGGRTPLLRKQPGYVGNVARGGVGRSKPSNGGMMGLGGSAMASAGSRAMASTMDPYGGSYDRHSNNVPSLGGGTGGTSSTLGGVSASSASSMASTITRRQRNGIGGSSRKVGNTGVLPMIGDNGGGSSNSSVGSVASTAMPTRRRHRHGGGQHVHTGIPVTKSERSVRAGTHSIEGVKPGHANWSNQDNFLVSSSHTHLRLLGFFFFNKALWRLVPH